MKIMIHCKNKRNFDDGQDLRLHKFRTWIIKHKNIDCSIVMKAGVFFTCMDKKIIIVMTEHFSIMALQKLNN